MSIFKFIYVVVVIFLAGFEAAFISFPRNKMALANDSVELRCSTDSGNSLKWSVTYALSMEVIGLFIEGNFADDGKLKYRIDTRIPGQCNLIIDSVDLSYAGKYMCTEEPFGPEVEAELAVIDPQPLCLTNANSTGNTFVENDYLRMMCSLSFSGSLNLSMSWLRSSTGNVIQCTSNSRNQSTIVIQVNSADNGETFTLKATFEQENNSRQTVVTWSHKAKVLYRPRNLVINPIKSTYQVNDLLVCSSDGNPTPNYTWTDTAGMYGAVHGPILTIKDHMRSDQNHSFSCTAYNSVAGIIRNISETVTFSVRGSPLETPHTSKQTMVLAIVVALTVFCFIQLMIYGCFKVCSKIKLKRQEAMVEAHQSELNRDLEEETTLANEHSQHQETTYQNLDKERSRYGQQYSGLHIYVNATVNTVAGASDG